MVISLSATPLLMSVSRRTFLRVCSGAVTALVAPPAGTLLPGVAAQTVPLEDLVPAGWVIGAALNQNQSDGRDTAAVDLVTRQFNTISPENLLSDGDSWLNRGRMNHPLLWDRQRRPKPAFDEVVKVLMTP
jgi:GH35 family endo-1,4-beta-xylanase